MKQLISVTEVEGEGLESFLGEKVFLMCANYFYTGKLTGVNEKFVQLENASIVYDTGAWSAGSYSDAQKIGTKWYVTTTSIESYGPGK